MTAAVHVRLDTPQRQSLWAVVFLALRTLRQIGLVQIAVAIGFVLARLPSVTAFLALVLIIGVVMFTVAAIKWWRFTFVLVDDEIVVRRGVLEQQTLSIPLDRVQSVSLEQKLLHRIVKLVQVELDTAGTQAAEFVIDAVDQPVAQELQRVVADHRRTSQGLNNSTSTGEPAIGLDEPPAPPHVEETIVEHSPRRVLMTALTQTPFAGLILVAPLFAVANDIGEYIPFDLPTIDEPTSAWFLVWLIPGILIAGFLFSVVLNLVRVLLSDWNLTLRSTAAGLRRDAGLLNTTSVAATVPRVQIVRTSQGVLERWAKLTTVRLATIGNTNLVVPGCDPEQVQAVRRLALAESPGVTVLDQTVASQEVFLRTRNALVVCAALAGALLFAVGWRSLLLLLFVPWVWASTKRRVRLRRWAMNTEAIADHREFFGWNKQELLVHKINGVSVRQSLFEHKRNLATVTVSTAAGAVSIGMIPHTNACDLRDRVLLQVETDRRAFM